MDQCFMTSVTEHHENMGMYEMRTVLLIARFLTSRVSLETHIHNSFLVYIEAVIKAYCQMRLYS